MIMQSLYPCILSQITTSVPSFRTTTANMNVPIPLGHFSAIVMLVLNWMKKMGYGVNVSNCFYVGLYIIIITYIIIANIMSPLLYTYMNETMLYEFMCYILYCECT